MSQDGRRIAVWALLALALALSGFLRLEHQAAIARDDVLFRSPVGDERTFFDAGHRVATGQDDRIPYQAPLYPTLLGAVERATGSRPLVEARILQALLGLVTATLAARLAWLATGDRRAALVALFLAGLARPLIHAEGTLLRESASAAMLAAAVLAHARARERSDGPADHLGLGLALGLGVVLRENFAVLALFVVGERLLATARSVQAAPAEQRRDRTRRGATALLCLALGGALPVLPFDAKVARLGGGVHPLPHWNSGCVFYLANRRDNPTGGGYATPRFVTEGNPEAEVEGFTAEAERRTGLRLAPHEVSAFWLREGLREVAAEPGLFLRRVAVRALASVAPWETAHQRDPAVDAATSWVLRAPLVDSGALVALAAVGALLLARARRGASPPRRAVLGALALGLLAWWSSLLVAAFTTRYRVPATPLLAALGAVGAREVTGLVRERREGTLVILGAIVLVLVVGLRFGEPPHDPSTALLIRAQAAIANQELLAAVPDLEALVKRGGATPDGRALVLLGDARLRLGDPVRARVAFLEATRVAPRRAEAWRGLGLSELTVRRPRAALAALETGARLDPEGAKPLARVVELARRAIAESTEDPPAPAPHERKSE